MHLTELLHKTFEEKLPHIHKIRLKSIIDVSEAAVRNNQLSSVRPVIVTDAGFRAPWFAYILKLGWDFVGRLRHKNAVCIDGEQSWRLSSTYFKHATAKPTFLGHGLLTEEGKVPASL